MKKLLILIVAFSLIYSIYYDLRNGTLPLNPIAYASTTSEESHSQSDGTKKENFVLIKVKPGDTVLSLVEQNFKGNLSVSIQDVINDFEALNNGTSPEKIQIGKTYKIPLY